MFKPLVWLDPGKIPAQVGFEPGLFRSRRKLKHETLPNFPTCYFIHLQISQENFTFLSLIGFFFFFFFVQFFLVANTTKPGVSDCEKSHPVRAEGVNH